MDKKNQWKAWLYLAPVLVLMAIFTFYPIISTLVASFLKDYNNVTGENNGFTLYNYQYVLGLAERYEGSGVFYKEFFSLNPAEHSAFWNTMFITFVTVPISVILSLLIAILIHSIKPFKKFFQTVFFMPYVTNVIAVGMVFSLLFSQFGIWNRLFGLSTAWLTDNAATWESTMFVLCLYVIWSALPYKILIFLSGLEGIDRQYYEAAKIDGAGRLKTTWKVTVPLLSPQILYITVTSFIGAFKEYSSVVGLLGRSYTSDSLNNDMYTAVYWIYDQMKKDSWNTQSQFADAAAMILLAVIFLFTLIELWISKKKVVYR